MSRWALGLLLGCATAPAAPPRSPPRAVEPPAAVPVCPLALPATSGEPAGVLGARVAKVCLLGAGEGTAVPLYEAVAPREGQLLTEAAVLADLRALFAQGTVRDAAAVAQRLGDGRVVLSYHVTEYPEVERVRFDGVRSIAMRELEELAPPGGRASPLLLKRLEDAVTRAYREQGFREVEVRLTGEAELTVHVAEGPRAVVRAIRFPGAQRARPAELVRVLQSMVGLPFREERLEADALALTAALYDRGLVQARVEAAFAPLAGEPGAIELVFTLVEGPVFTLRRLTLGGELWAPEREVLRGVESRAGAVFSRAALQRDIARIKGRAEERGLLIEVTPVTNVDPQARRIDVTLDVERRPGPIRF